MASHTPRVLFVDADDEALQAARETLVRRAIECHDLTWGDTPPEDPLLRPGGINVVVIGPGVANPAAAARRLARVHQAAHLLFVAPPERLEETRRMLLYSAPQGTPWQLLSTEQGDLAQAILAGVEASQRRAQFRSTLDRMNLQLASSGPLDAQHYRRLVVSDHYLASVLRHAADAIISLDLQGRVLSWNTGAERLFGLPAREVVGDSLERVARWLGAVEPLLQEAVRQGSVRREVALSIAGRDVLVDATFSAIEERRGEAIAVAAILRDITERRRIEAALAENEARFRALADNIPQLAWMTDAEGSIFWYNKRWFEYTGKTLEEMAGWGWRAVHHPDHRERVVQKFKAHIESGEAWEDTFPLRSRNGGYRWFLSRAFPIRDAAGHIINWFGTNTDITGEREAQEALREADRRKDEFIGLLSHELRNPLAPIRNSIYLLERLERDAPAARRAHEVIRRQTEHLTRLVDDLLDVTRIARGKIELRRSRADLAAIVRNTLEDYWSVMDAQGVALDTKLPEQPVHCDLDAARIGQVFGNLLQNAIKFTPPGGEVEVRLAVEGEWARIDVCDTGVGIEPELLKTLFQPFVQGRRSLGREQGGLGLGLALARGIVELHGGTLTAESGGADQGSTFTVRLPCIRPEAVDKPHEAQASSRQPGQRRVLIVDDNHDAADSLAELVNLFGHNVEVAYDGPSALRQARTRAPDVVLCDIGLPGMDGYEVARRLRAQQRSVQLVAVSGYAQAADLAQARAAGFDHHIAKPPQPDEIRRLLS